MANRISEYPIREFAPVTSLSESTHTGTSLTKARNVILRPKGGFKGTLKFERLLGIPTFSTLRTTIHGATPAATLKTCAIKITSQGKNWLIFYDWVNNKCRGLFYLGDIGGAGSIADEGSGIIGDESGEAIMEES